MAKNNSSKKETSVEDQAAALEEHIKGSNNGKTPVKKKTVPKKKVAPKKKATTKKAPVKSKGKKAANSIVGKVELLKVNPAKLVVVWEDNPRKDYGDMKTLEASILSRGVENPIRVTCIGEDGELKLEAGYRRVKACLNLIEGGHKIRSIPAILEKKGTTEKETLIHVFVENDGKSFNPMEEATLFQGMKDNGMSEREIGESIGRGVATITRRLSLLKASVELQTALRKEVIPLRIALRIIKANKKDHKEQEKLLVDFVRETSSGDKEKTKAARNKVAKASGIRRNTSGLTQAGAKKLLDEIAIKFTSFARTQKPANSLNKAWLELEASLKKTRTLKRKGKFK